MQKAYLGTLYKFMKEDKNVISCLSDSGTDYDEIMARELPKQVINFGISENNKIGASSGMAMMGKIPFVYTTNAFLAYRSYEFIRDDVCLQNANVKIVGMGSGISWSTLGPTHHTTEDISALKALPNLTILNPASPKELVKCLEYAKEHIGPVYIRMGMGNEEEIYENECPFTVSKNIVISEGDIITFTTGPIISEVLKAKEMLKEHNINLKVINVPTIKPFANLDTINNLKDAKIAICIEENNIIGGLGSSIASLIATEGLGIKLYKIGINDEFAKGYGTYSEIKKMNHLDAESLKEKILEILK